MAELDIRVKPDVRIGLIGARKNMGLNQQQLADLVYMSRSHLAALELGTNNGGEDTWKELCKILKIKNPNDIWQKYNYNKDTGKFKGDCGGEIDDPLFKKIVIKKGMVEFD